MHANFNNKTAYSMYKRERKKDLSKYSRVRNKRTGGNKHTGGIFSPKQ